MAERHPAAPDPDEEGVPRRKTLLWRLTLAYALLKVVEAAYGEAPASVLARAFAVSTKALIESLERLINI